MSHSQGQGKCLGALVHRWNVRLSNSEVGENVWMHLFTVATDCVTQRGQGKCLSALVHNCNKLCQTVRSGKIPGCTCALMQQTVSHIEEGQGYGFPLLSPGGESRPMAELCLLSVGVKGKGKVTGLDKLTH